MIPPIVDAAWLRDHGAAVVVADVRWYLDDRDGRTAYDAGHVPGAVFVDLDADLAAPGSPAEGRHPLPDPADFAAAMGRLGIGDDDTVVAYDDQGGVMAARLVWMLRATGRAAALLDGGIGAYHGPLETDAPHPTPKRFTATPWPSDRVASIDDAADTDANVVLDARQRERYLGEPNPLDPRSGHIPGARSLPARESVDEAGRFLPIGELRRRLVAVGIDRPDTPVVASCGSGVTACHNLLVMEHAGVGHGRLFPGSWSQWANDSRRAVETGEDVVVGSGSRKN
jgi:thiosulfate/3-mercaptopyruvate sulfurtransferase